MPDGSFKFWILDGNGSIDGYRLPRLVLEPASGVSSPPPGFRIVGVRLNKSQVDRVFRDWLGQGMLPLNLFEILDVKADLALSTGPDDGKLNPPLDSIVGGVPYLSIIEFLWIYLGIWLILGLITSLWNFKASNT
jgi:hypothetical protein